MSASHSPAYDSAVTRVLRWCEVYTQGLPEQVATDRRDELISDLYEQSAASVDQSDSSLARAVRFRSLRGVPADLAWRTRRVREFRLASPREALSFDTLHRLAAIAGVLLLVAGTFAVVRSAQSFARGDWWFAADLPLLVVAATVAAVCGVVLLIRPRTRGVGAVWLAAAAYGVIRYGGRSLIYSSVSYSQAAHTVPYWDALSQVATIGAVFFFLVVAASAFLGQIRGARRRTTFIEKVNYA